MLDYMFALASTVIMLVCMALSPTKAACPAGWWLAEGVRADGEYVCRPLPPVVDGVGERGGWVDVSPSNNIVLRGKIYCSGSRPITDNGRVVGCQR